MKLPITIIESNGDRTICATVADTESSMEPIDVRNGEYTATDANGKQLVIEVIIEGEPRSKWQRIFASPIETTRLRNSDAD